VSEKPAEELNFRELLERLRETLDKQDQEIERKPSLKEAQLGRGGQPM